MTSRKSVYKININSKISCLVGTGMYFDLYKEENMRTRIETISPQEFKVRKATSNNPIGLIKFAQHSAGLNLQNRSEMQGGNETKNTTHHSIISTKIQNIVVTNITTMFGEEYLENASNMASEKSQPWWNGLQAREEKMEGVKRNIFKYAIYAMVSLSAAFSQGTPRLDIHIADQKINLTEAEQKDASKISYAPGDTIHYLLTASNVGDGLMTEPEIVDPIPAGVTYIAGSAAGEDTEITFSMNQGAVYMVWPPNYTVRNSKGILVKREATPEMISHIKWSIQKSLKPGESATMEFVVVVNK